MSDRQINVRQIAQYPRGVAAGTADVALLQQGGLGGPYVSILAQDFVATALAQGGRLQINPNTGAVLFGDPAAGGGALSVAAGAFLFSLPVTTSAVNAAFIDAPSITVAGVPVATSADLDATRAASVTSFNFRQGDVLLERNDILRAGGAPIRDAHFAGWITAPSVWDARANDDTVATANWVHRAIHDTGVSSFNGRVGDIVLSIADVNAAYASAPPGVFPTAPNPVLGDASNRIATTLFVDESLIDLHAQAQSEWSAADNIIYGTLTSQYAPLNSPNFIGTPTGPTANPGTHTGQLATTAFVMSAITASTSGVASFNTRTGAVVLTGSDVTAAGGALTVSPAFTGTPSAPTPAPGNSSTQLATTAFVQAALTSVTAGVSSFNARTGAVTLTTADVTGAGGALIASPIFTGVPAAPTAVPGTNTTQLATTAFVAAAVAAGVTSFMGRTGAISLLGADVSAAGGALIASPTFTGVPAAPTAVAGTSTTQLATTAFVAAAISSMTAGVTTFNGRAGAVTLTAADVTGVGGALTTSPTFTGTPAAPTATAGTNTTQLATTAFVAAALSGATPGWTFASAGGVSTQTALNPAVLNLTSGVKAWNPGDLNLITLTNNNLTAAGLGGAGWNQVRATGGYTSGKYYWEIRIDNWTDFQTVTGVSTPGIVHVSGIVAGTSLINNTGNIYVNTAQALGNPTLGARTNGNVIGIALDAGAKLIWFRVAPSGNWNGSGTANPATGTGGVDISGVTGAASGFYPVFACNPTGEQSTANFGASSFSGAPPSGFAAPSSPDYQINNNSNGGVVRILDNTSSNATPANFLVLTNNISGQPSIISTAGTDTNRSIQLVPNGTGTVQAPTMAAGNNSTAVATTAFVTSAVVGPVLRSYLAGLTLSTAGSSATFSVAVGVAADSTTARMIALASALSKTTSAWAVGNNNGGLDTGTIAASTWYHAYLIMRTDTSVVDVLVSLSASAPALPSPYTLFRRIGAMRTNASSQWTAFVQNGDTFLWSAGVFLDANGVAGNSTSRQPVALTVPPGVVVTALHRSNVSGATAAIGVSFTSADELDQAASTTGYSVRSTQAGDPGMGTFLTRTNTAQQIFARSSGTCTFFVMTYGWVDRRGQDA